jgi:carbonic anhydrase
MEELIRGIHRFDPTHFRSSHAVFEQPTRSGKPEALLITCSDIEVNPFDLIPTNVENLYIQQNSGNLVSPYDEAFASEPSQVEQALAIYSIKDIIICGHSPCAVMHYLLSKETDDGRNVIAWLARAARTKAIMQEYYARIEVEQQLAIACEENVLVQLENVCTLPSVAARLNEGTLHLHGWFHVQRSVFTYDARAQQFVALAQ